MPRHDWIHKYPQVKKLLDTDGQSLEYWPDDEGLNDLPSHAGDSGDSAAFAPGVRQGRPQWVERWLMPTLCVLNVACAVHSGMQILLSGWTLALVILLVGNLCCAWLVGRLAWGKPLDHPSGHQDQGRPWSPSRGRLWQQWEEFSDDA